MNNPILKRPFFVGLFVVFAVFMMGLEPLPKQSVFADNRLAAITPTPTPQAPVTRYDKAVALSPKDAEVYLNRGNAFLAEERVTEALEDFNRAIELNPEYAEAYFSRGVLYFKQMKYDEALYDFTQTIDLNSKYAEAYYFRGRIFIEQEQLDAAIKDFTVVINLNVAFVAPAYYQRATAFANQNHFDLALKDIDQTLSINPQYAVAYALRGQIFDYQGKSADALKSYHIFLQTAGGPVDPSVIERVKALEALVKPSIATDFIRLDKTFISPKKLFTIQYPSSWVKYFNSPYKVSIGNSARVAQTAFNFLSPDFKSGDRAIQVNYVSEDSMPSGVDLVLNGDPMIFLRSLLLYVPSTTQLGVFETYRLGTLNTARVILKTTDVEAFIYAFFVDNTPVYVVGAAAPGELAQFQFTLEAMILSLHITADPSKNGSTTANESSLIFVH